LPDSDIELGPAENHPLGNAALDAMTVFNLKDTINEYGERGFVPITLLGVSGMPQPAELQKTEAWWNRLLRFGFKEQAKVVNSDAVTVTKVGAGMDELKGSFLEIRRDAKESIADAFGIPTALFMSDNAYASEFDAIRKQWYSTSRFVGIYQTIQEVFNEQLFEMMGYYLYFTPESLDVFQTDESKRSNSLSSFVSAVSSDPEAAQLGMGILGYDLNKEQRTQLDDILKRKEEDRAKMDEQLEQSNQVPEDADMEDEDEETKTLDAEALKELALWYSKARQWYPEGKSTVEWETKHIDESIAAPIRVKLADAQSEQDIVDAFTVIRRNSKIMPIMLNNSDEAIKSLADVIEKAMLAEKAAPNNITINTPPITLNAQMPPNGTVTVNVPEQPVPIVNVSVPETQVTVNNAPINNIEVQPAEVILPRPSSAKVERDAQGKISGIVTNGNNS
jgi:hypothetical protein